MLGGLRRSLARGCQGRRTLSETSISQLKDGKVSEHWVIVLIAIVALSCSWPRAAAAQSDRFELGAQVPTTVSRELDSSDVGIGGRFSWHPSVLLGVEAEVDLYPRHSGPFAFSRRRVEGLFGVTVGPTFGRARPFARLRPGFMIFRAQPIVCILIFPPPLPCALASGATVFALDIGGGLEVSVTRNTFVRVDAGDRLLKYPGPAFDSSSTAHRTAFFGHDFRLALGGGLKF